MSPEPTVRKEWLVLSLLLFLFLAAISPSLPGLEYDRECWSRWAEHLGAAGLSEAYELPGNNYPPFYEYILWIYAKLAGDRDAIWRNIGYLRVFTLVFEFWGIWLVYKWLGRRPDFGYLLVCAMLNVAYSYNAVLWGQVDGIMATLTFAAFYYLAKNRLLLSAAFLILALNMKLQAIIYLPLWGMLMLAALHRGQKWRLLPLILLVLAGVQAAMLLPFAFGAGGLKRVWQVVAELPDYFPYLSMNAYNIWYWLVEGAGPRSPDTIRMLGVTAKQLGLIGFCTASFFALLPVLKHLIAVLRGRAGQMPAETVWLSAMLVTLSFFYFNTQMHERYAHGAFIFLTAYAFQRRSFGLYALFSAAYLLNLESQLRAFRLQNYETLIFDPRFVAVLFGACIVWAFVLLYRQRRPERGSAAAEAISIPA